MNKKVFKINSLIIAIIFTIMALGSGSDDTKVENPTEQTENVNYNNKTESNKHISENEICCCCNGSGKRKIAINGDSYRYGTRLESCHCCEGDGKVTLEKSNELKKNSLFCE